MRRGPLILLCVTAALLAIWELVLFPSWTIRYRLTIHVAVGDEVRSGSGVIEMIWHSQRNYPLTEVPWSLEIRGEAISVDLGSRGPVFVLLDPPEAPRHLAKPGMHIFTPAIDAFSPDLSVGTMTGWMLSSIAWRHDAADLVPSFLPMMLRFRDINDPTTVEEVDPSDLADSFGPNVKIVRATVQIVPSGFWPFNRFNAPFPQWLFGEPITTGIEKQLPSWYLRLLQAAKLRNRPLTLSGQLPGGSPSLANELSTYEIQRGVGP